MPKTYLVKVSGQPGEEDIGKLRRGIRIDSPPGERRAAPAHTAPAQIRLLREAENPWYEVTLIEGKNRQIRRMFEEIGHHVEKIKRVRYGPLTLDVEPGQFRVLTPREVAMLQRSGTSRSGRQTQIRQPAQRQSARPGKRGGLGKGRRRRPSR